MYKSLIFPLLARMDAETAHERALRLLEWGQRGWRRPFLQKLAGSIPQKPVSLWGLTFPNVLGMAAGFDKEVRVAEGLALLGFGHVEVGTLTPHPQAGNPRPRIFRLRPDGALINRMGFPNAGVDTAVSHLQQLGKRDYILGVSLGKQKETPLADAAQDYLAVMEKVYPYADYLAVNISSPNTPGLRDLQGSDYLYQLLRTLTRANWQFSQQFKVRRRPLLVKIAPDLTWPELDEILTAVQDTRIDGIIATNTTTSRAGLTDPAQTESGGLSGRPLRQRSAEIIAYIHKQTGGKLPMIGVGGVASAADAQAKLDAGASLVQLYTALVYEGPRLPGRILRRLS
ncbi:MAG TPA: quinone-dependent dihydroorotate dehydrogenase [Chloroflexi bacterium]|nr:quinone-dependent dihydroorotate dehydrogenase [Chloroflexota bacterium]